MEQIWISKAGPPGVLELRELPDPLPKNGEIRIRVAASGINFADVMGRMGIYRDAPSMPYVPGYEVAGTVDMLGQGVGDFQEGDPVLALTHFGGYSSLVCVPYKQVFKRLAWMSPADGAALPVNYLTAYQALIIMGSLRPADKVLIHNVGGGVGLAALDLCRIIGAETFGTASATKHEFLQQRGLDHAIDYRQNDYESVVRELTKGVGVQLILDSLGGEHWVKNYRLLMPSGRLIHMGVSSMAPGKKRSRLAQLRQIMKLPFYNPVKLMNENKVVGGVNVAHMWAQTGLLRGWMAQLINWYDEALFRPHIDTTFPFAKAAEAHHYLQDRQNKGKVLLLP